MRDRVRSWCAALRPAQAVVVLAAALAALALAAWQGTSTPDAPVRDLHAPWLLLFGMFVVAETVVLHVQVKRQAQTVSLCEIPLVLGLLCATPGELLTARVAGSLVAFLVLRRQPHLKTLFNTALVSAGTCVALLVFPLVLGDGDSVGPRGWLAAYVAAAAASLVDGVAVTLVIAAYEHTVRVRETVRETLHAVVASAAVTTLALTAVNDVSAHRADALLLAVQAGLLVVAYRSYAALSRRHLGLERVYRFSQVLSRSPEIDEILRGALGEAKEMLNADVAEVLLFQDTGRRAVRVTLGRSDQVVRADAQEDDHFSWLRAQVFDRGVSALLTKQARDEEARSYLRSRGWTDAVVVPLRGDAGVIGALLVADRLGDLGTFQRDDIVLLETVANHASTALQNGQLVDQLRHDSLHDALTGLPNRVRLQRDLSRALERLATGEVPGATVMVLDLDGFKDVNDTLGHQQGDRLLQEVGRRLVEAVGEAGSVARLGGDEFAVLLPDSGREEPALKVGRCILNALQQPVPLDGLEVEVGASVGVALSPEHGTEAAVLLKRADMAMYAAKGGTRGLRLYEPEQDSRDVKRLTLVGELRQALQDGGLEVHVQPQARLTDGAVVSAEALVRWHHPELGPVSPEEFIPVAERSGLISPLTTFVLDTALSSVRDWRDAGHDLSVAVNLSTRSLLDLDLVEDVRRLLRRHALPGEALTLEITEGGVMADPPRAVALLLELRALGVRLSVDDFGTGYSSLSYLKRLPVQEVKIDKSFVTHLSQELGDEAIARSIVDLGRHLGLDVVAEGVEDIGSWDRLAEMGCTLSQGWYLARPMPAVEMGGWLDDYVRAHRAHRVVAPVLRVV